MSFRKESKYRLTYSDLAQLQKQLLMHGMKELYPVRVINSCYFDTDSQRLFYESEEGVTPRKKIRVRWYNNELNFKKETKISSIEGRFKSSELMPKFKNVNDVLKDNFYDKNYGILKPSLIVSYERYYFSLKLLRITFDRNITYKFLRNGKGQTSIDPETVMEVKTSQMCSDDYIKKIIPHSSSRFSKYCRGLLSFERN